MWRCAALIFATILIILTGILAVARASDSPDAVWTMHQTDDREIHVYPIELYLRDGQYLWRPAFAWNWIVWLALSIGTIALVVADYRRWLVQRAARYTARKAVANAPGNATANTTVNAPVNSPGNAD